VRLLLRRGARLEAMDSEGKTPLVVSGHTGHAPVVRALLEAGASPLATDPFGNTANPNLNPNPNPNPKPNLFKV